MIFLFVLIGYIVSAQDTADKPFFCFSPQPEYPGGEVALIKFMQKNLKYPEIANDLGIHGKVIVSFMINNDGSVSDVGVKKSVSKALDKEAMRVISLLHFLPLQQSDTFKTPYVIPIIFGLASDTIIKLNH